MSSFCHRSTILHKGSSPLIKVRNRRSMTLHTLEIVPLKKDPTTLEEIQEDIQNSYKCINGIIDKYKGLVVQKLQAQQIQLLSVFKSTMDKMMVEVEEVVNQYKSAILEVKLQPSMNKLENELNYFKTEALELFQINKRYKKQIETLKGQITDLKIQKQVHYKTIEKLTKKVFRGKNKNSSILTDVTTRLIEPPLPSLAREPPVRYKSIQTERTKTLGDCNRTTRYH